MYSQSKDNLVLKLAQMFVSFGWVGGGGIKGIDYPPTTQTLYPPRPQSNPPSQLRYTNFPLFAQKTPHSQSSLTNSHQADSSQRSSLVVIIITITMDGMCQ